MFTVALLAQKGGVGKTTLAYTLAVQAELSGQKAAIIDCDPQASAWSWSQKRAKTGKDSPPVAAVATPSKLREAFATAKAERITWLFIDTPPGVSEVPATAAADADLILIPCAPAILTMDAMLSTVELVKKVATPAFFVINRGRSKQINDDCLAGLVSAYGLPATNAHISTRLPIVDAEGTGLALPELKSREPSVTKGQEEVRALWKWLTDHQKKGHSRRGQS